MKKILLVFIIFLFGFSSFAQNEIPESVVNLGIGFGVPFGGLGVKSVLGSKNTGLLLSCGLFPGTAKPGYMLGFQISNGVVYADLGYGVVAMYEINDQEPETLTAGIVLVGGMVPLNKSHRLFLDIGMGLSFGPKLQEDYFEISRTGFLFNIGLGFRLGNNGNTN